MFEEGEGFFDEGVAFDIFFSIGEEANFGVGFAKSFFGIEGGHDGKLGEHDGGDFGVGADIHDGDGAVFGGDDGTEAGTFDPFDATELSEGIGHDTTGVTSADEGICFPFFDEGHADGHGGLQATKFASGDFVCHFESVRRVDECYVGMVGIVFLKERLDNLFVSDKNYFDIKVLCGFDCGYYFGKRMVVTAHGI